MLVTYKFQEGSESLASHTGLVLAGALLERTELTRLSHFKKNIPIFNGLWLQALQTSFKFCLG